MLWRMINIMYDEIHNSIITYNILYIHCLMLINVCVTKNRCFSIYEYDHEDTMHGHSERELFIN